MLTYLPTIANFLKINLINFDIKEIWKPLIQINHTIPKSTTCL